MSKDKGKEKKTKKDESKHKSKRRRIIQEDISDDELNEEIAAEFGEGAENLTGNYEDYGQEEETAESQADLYTFQQREEQLLNPPEPKDTASLRQQRNRGAKPKKSLAESSSKEDRLREINKIQVHIDRRLGINRRVFTSRLETKPMPDIFVPPRDVETFERFKDTWDCITLKLHRMPQNPYITVREAVKIDATGGFTKHTHSVFYQRRDFKKTTEPLYKKNEEEGSSSQALLPSQQNPQSAIIENAMQLAFGEIISKEIPDEKADSKKKRKPSPNAMSYLQQTDKSYTGQQTTKMLKQFYAKKLRGRHYPEWLHTVANSMGGPITVWNGAAGAYGANTKMAAIENAIAGKPGIGVTIEAYTQPDTRIAEWYVYTVYAYDANNTIIDTITFHIDARQQWYTKDEWVNDKFYIDGFLKETAGLRRNVKTSDFELPEIEEVRLINGKQSKLIDLIPEEGPLFGSEIVGQAGHFVNYDSNVSFVKNVQGEAFRRYEGYRKRMHVLYPFHQKEIIDALSSDNPDLIFAALEKHQVAIDTVDVMGNNIIHYAAKYNCVNFANYLFKNEKLSEEDFILHNDKGYTPLQTAIIANNVEFIKSYITAFPDTLITPDIDPDSANDFNSPLHLAMLTGNIDVITILLQHYHGDELRRLNANGDTPLHLAVRANNIDVFRELKIPDLHIKNSNGDSLLHEAVKFNRLDLVKLFIDEFKLDETNAEGETILHIAAMYGSVEVLDFLLTNTKLNPDIKNAKQETPLHVAAIYGQADAAMHLIAHGANKKETDEKDMTAYQVALEMVETDVANVISNYDVELAKIYIENNNAADSPRTKFKKSPKITPSKFILAERRGEQRGWNCGDVALGINREALYRWLKTNADDNTVRQLLAPEIINAAVMSYVLGFFNQDADKDSLDRQIEIGNLLEILSEIETISDSLKNDLTERLQQLLHDQEEDVTGQTISIHNLALPANMLTNGDLFQAVQEYIEADSKVASLVVEINKILFAGSELEVNADTMLGFEELTLYFNETHPQQNELKERFKNSVENFDVAVVLYYEAWAIINPAKEKLTQLCEDVKIFSAYVDGYYAPQNKNWLAFQPSIGGTSIIDVIAKMLNKKIIVWELDSKGDFRISHQTAEYSGERVNILYNGHNHYIALYPNIVYALMQAEKQEHPASITGDFFASTPKTKSSDQLQLHTSEEKEEKPSDIAPEKSQDQSSDMELEKPKSPKKGGS